MEMERRNNIYAMLTDLFGIDPLAYGESPHDRFHGFSCIWEVVDIHGRRDFRTRVLKADRFMSLMRTGNFPPPPKTPEPIEPPVEKYMTSLVAAMHHEYVCGHTEPVERVLSQAAAWIHLNMIYRTAYPFVFHDTEDTADWQPLARRWLAEKLPPMWRYVLVSEDSFKVRNTDPKILPTSVGRMETYLAEVGTILSVDYLPPRTRLELLMETDVSTGCVSLSKWYDNSVMESGVSQFDTAVLLRIGDRLLKPEHDLYFGKHSSNFLHICVADHLAIASSMLGYTRLNAPEIAMLASGLWAPAAFQTGPFISKNIMRSTSPVLLSYILRSEENLSLMVDAFRTMKRLSEDALYERDGSVIFNRWHLRNDQVLRVVDMIRTQTGRPGLKDSILCKEEEHGVEK